MKKSIFYGVMMLVSSSLSMIIFVTVYSIFEDTGVPWYDCFAYVFLLASLILLAIGINSFIEKAPKEHRNREIHEELYYCPKCGEKISFQTKFCSGCGSKLNWN